MILGINQRSDFKISSEYNTKSDEKKAFGTFEWADQNANFISGCKHDCKYCYSKELAIRFNRKTSEDWENEEIRENSFNKNFKKRKGTIMFPSAHDIHPDNLIPNIQFLHKLLLPGNRILLVTKPHIECIKKICTELEQYKENLLFRFTIGSCDSQILRFWEPGAPGFNERLESLKYAYKQGFQTSVSCEPMLDNEIVKVIDFTIKYVTNSIWIGKFNFLIRRLKMNGEYNQQTKQKAHMLIESQTDDFILSLYSKYKNNHKIKWKESIKKIVGLELSSCKGLDN